MTYKICVHEATYLHKVTQYRSVGLASAKPR